MTDKPKAYAVAEPTEVTTYMSLHDGAFDTAQEARAANFRSELEARFYDLQRNCSDSVDALYALAEHNPDMLRVLVGDIELATPKAATAQAAYDAFWVDGDKGVAPDVPADDPMQDSEIDGHQDTETGEGR